MVGVSLRDCNLSDIEKELKEVEKYKEELNERKAQLEATNLNLKEDSFYEIRGITPDSTYYCQGSNISVHDGSGTVGYSHTQYALIHKGLYQTSHRFSGNGGYVEGLTFDIGDLKRRIDPVTIEEISLDDYCKVKNEIKRRL